jgi:hypothetical protein
MVVHGGVTLLMENAFPVGPIVRFKPISNSQWSLITLRAMQAVPTCPASSSRFRPISATLCVFAMILVPCTSTSRIFDF